jgi:hypothetical protein
MTMATRHDLSDEQWGRIEGILGFSTYAPEPKPKTTMRKPGNQE